MASKTPGWFERFAAKTLENAPVPSEEVLSQPITPEVVKAYPEYFIIGPGREIAERTDCGHGYRLTDSCPCC